MTVGLSRPANRYFPVLAEVQHVADECVVGLLADLLGAGADGAEQESLIATLAELLGQTLLPKFRS